MAKNVLVQALIEPDLAAWLHGRASAEGIGLSGWLRNRIAMERDRLLVKAWTVSAADRERLEKPERIWTDRPMHRFVFERTNSPSGLEFRAYEPDGKPYEAIHLGNSFGEGFARDFRDGYVVLAGSLIWWKTRTFEDADGQLIVALVPSDEMLAP